MKNDHRAFWQELRSRLEKCQTVARKLQKKFHQAATGAVSELGRRAAKLMEKNRRAGHRLAALRRTSVGALQVGTKAAGMIWGSLASAVGPVPAHVTRWLRTKLMKRSYYHPLEVAERPVPAEEDPRLAQKVEDMRAWMKEQGIEEPPVHRKPPRAVGRDRPIPVASVKQGRGQD